ncbi:major facilitator superfamily domain-containing protein [Trichoderma sp. SZMC 28011]
MAAAEDYHPKQTVDPEVKVADEDATGQDQPAFSGPALALVMMGLGLTVFLIALDTSIVATAIPFITEHFHSTADIGWCSLQPLSGKLFATFSLKWTFLGFFALFELGSLLCATAVNSNMFICGRAIAGAGGAGIVSGAFSIVCFIIPLVQRPLYIGGLSSVFGVATVVGPILGGVFTQNEKSITNRVKDLDLVGAFLFIPAIVMVLLALQWGGSAYPWRSATIIGLFLGFGGLLAVFVGWEVHKGDDAMIPPSILLTRTVAFSCLTLAMSLGGVFVVKGAGPTHSGVMNIPAFLSQIVGTILAGGLVTKLGALNPWMWAGSVVLAVATGLYCTFDVDTGAGRWIGYQILQGFGFGVMAQMPIVAVQATLPPALAPVAVSMATFAQFFGGAIFVAVAQTVFSNVLISELAIGAPDVDPKVLLLAGSGAIRRIVSPDSLPAVLEAFNKAIVATFYVSTATSATSFFTSLGVPWINVKGKNLMKAPGEV